MYDESASHYGNAIDVLELRVKNIKARIEEVEQQDKGKGKASDDDPLVKDRKELADLEDLLPEVKEKVCTETSETFMLFVMWSGLHVLKFNTKAVQIFWCFFL